jgi:hypothetical protein
MDAQDYFSPTRVFAYNRSTHDSAIHAPLPQPCKRKTSAEHDAFMRRLLRGWCEPSTTLPASRTVSFSSWTRVATPTAATPFGELKASVICKGSGTMLSYDPPASEWTYLGAEQPLNCGKPAGWTGNHRRQKGSGNFVSASSTSSGSELTEPITFRKQQPKRVCTESQLTGSIKSSINQCSQKEMATLADRVELDSMTCEDLPSAFDSDSEDDEDSESDVT